MKRGTFMPRGIALAVPVALMRGYVIVFIRLLLNPGEFLIIGNGLFIMVAIRFARKSLASIAEIEAEFAEVITGLRLVPRTGPVSCELWLYSRYGTLRHFRVGDAGLVEVDCYGTPLDQKKPVVIGALPFVSGEPAPHGAPLPVPSVPGTADKHGPILRWLAKWNAARTAGNRMDAAENSELRKILDAGGPGTKKKRSSGKNPPGKNPAPAGPAVPAKNPGPENPVVDTNPDATTNVAGERPGGAVPEEKPGPVKAAGGVHPASAAGTLAVVNGQSPDRRGGSPESARDGGEV
ncbi:MAG TPA: hypothetical protein HA272_09075 [Methanoregula sp.]|nr:hypothetical protein [Methanoregula sp.]